MSVFSFKQFDVKQSDAAMKVGTDSVLLGSLLQADRPERILDIGTGTGLLALMLAQRFADARIEAVEIDQKAFEEALYNFRQSKWADRISVVNGPFQEFDSSESHYDLIVSNPPYYKTEDHFSIAEGQRSVARQTDTLSFDELLSGVLILLSERGMCWMILPVREYDWVKQRATERGLFVTHQITVHPKKGRDCNRVIFCLTRHQTPVTEKNVCVYDRDGQYTQEYKECTGPFLLWKTVK